MNHLPFRHKSARQLSRSLAVITMGLTLMLSCEAREPAAGTSGSAAARASVDSATTTFHQALRTNDTAGFLSFLNDDVAIMPPGEAPVRGKEAIRAWYADFLTHYRTSSLTLADREVFVGEGWAAELGTYEWGLTPVAGGTTVVDRGSYMQMWKQLPDGHWRFAREVWNSSVPPASPSGQ